MTMSAKAITPNPDLRLFDTHAHFFTSDTTGYPVNVTGAREGEEVIIHRIKTGPATPEHIFGLWDACGVTGGAAVQYHSIYKKDNSYCIAAADKHAKRLSAVLMLDATLPATPSILCELTKKHNICGLRLFGFPDAEGNYPWLDSTAALESWEVAADTGLHMVVMYAPGQPSLEVLGRVKALAQRFPQTSISLDHLGWPALDADPDQAITPAHKFLADQDNISLKFTQINFHRFIEAGTPADAFLRRAVDIFGPHRIMWGSDVGNTKNSYKEMVANAISSTRLLTDTERAMVLHDNGAKLFARRAIS
ncbi:amidohydrolase family protein [Parasphingorhabdus sp.]|uniref:amidohydrolase family protein n=1 Tax=Parasphingorhabdus sp. TaxID=2709688 RepID=UPI003A93ADC2